MNPQVLSLGVITYSYLENEIDAHGLAHYINFFFFLLQVMDSTGIKTHPVVVDIAPSKNLIH